MDQASSAPAVRPGTRSHVGTTGVVRQPAPARQKSPGLTAAEDAADAVGEGIRAAPHSPVAAGFTTAQRLLGAARGAAKTAAGSLERSLRDGPALYVDRDDDPPLVVAGD